MRSFVLDASIALEPYSPKPNLEELHGARAVLRVIAARQAIAFVPRHWHMEVADRLLKWRRSHAISKTLFDAAALYLAELPVDTDPIDQDLELETVIERAQRYHVQGFDLPYLDLAVELDVPLATLDSGLQSAARREGIELFQP